MSRKYKDQDVRICINCHLPIEGWKPRKGDTQVHKNITQCMDLLFAQIQLRDQMLLDASQGKSIDPRIIFYNAMQRQIQHIEQMQKQLEDLRTFIIQFCEERPTLAQMKEISNQIESELEAECTPEQPSLL